MVQVPVRRGEVRPRAAALLTGVLVALLLLTACKTTPKTDPTLGARGKAAFPGEAFVMLEISSNGPERDQAFIERSKAKTDGPSGLAMQLAEALGTLLDSEARPPLVIGGRSSAKTKQVVLDGVGLMTRNLAGQRILFVGSRADEPEVRAAVEGIGGRLLHAEYGQAGSLLPPAR